MTRTPRRAARIIALDEAGRVLLIRGHDRDDPTHRWWFTPGGGLEDTESPRQAAVREFLEETGVVVTETELIGPVLRRHATFRFARATLSQDEVFFAVRLDAVRARAAVTGSGRAWTAAEKELLDAIDWRCAAQLNGSPRERVYPAGLAQLAAHVHAGWDGTCHELWEN
ncbi:NUDIX hydrolase [Actinotignum sanguinis]|uniref:NUDIX domain-containing protein n=2 Tax=Actinomycetaceae TaxID=2049 RepID=A0ABZ0RED1_9ACTO|nr:MULTISPECIES: NUDIX domain-containing protein [Actinotignum]WPJ89548.1 NUDIX domain-containing protein [Schaalia turicensis]MDE1553617.1 NUDIX domain-containing protein [Actinotignum sanguinis]MDE1565693.1 NUDIX domain-containing protein [Actinotignum sanguinis]MDE1577799.1 NUDIX domain-containing protein [Actinotignum sanguinis]MDE1642412.1 NUDIX domain-containing protein [Actinotignum sanguinis]